LLLLFRRSSLFAFVSCRACREDGAKAIEALNGFGYDHLVLAVEWAKYAAPPFLPPFHFQPELDPH
jgi:hypothetical protein